MNLRLDHAGWSAGIEPGCGGSVSRLDWNGIAVLRPAPPGATSPLRMASFPLLPFANRIANGRFGPHRLPRNFGDHPHALHGNGWQSIWTAEPPGEDRVRLRLEHDGGESWPWRYAAVQDIELVAGLARFRIELTNRDSRSMPAGLGFHPYFPLYPETRLMACAEAVWLTDEEQLPVHRADAAHFGNWAAGSPVAGKGLIDNAYAGWDGAARIEQPGLVLEIEASGAHAFHLYRPEREDFFCFEPVSHLPDAHNRPAFLLDRLEPGESLALEMRIAVRSRTAIGSGPCPCRDR